MTVREIAEETAVLLGRMDLFAYLGGNAAPDNAAELEKETEILVRCVNIVLNEIANEYVPLKKQAEAVTDNGIVRYEDFNDVLLDIVEITDDYGNKIKYKLYPDYLKTKPGTVFIEYTYLPDKKKLDDDIGYKNTRVSGRIVAYGTAGEYCLINGNYEEAYMWDKRYKDSLTYVTGARKKLNLKVGRWL